MKKLLIILSLTASIHVQGQNIRKGVELPTEAGTAGSSILPGTNDCALLGVNAGTSITNGSANVFMGNHSGANITTGHNNAFYGARSGQYLSSSSNQNTFLGNAAGQLSTGVTGYNSTFVGNGAGASTSASSFQYNTMVGCGAGFIFDGNDNTFVGAIGTVASSTSYSGDKLTLIGKDARNGSGGPLLNATAIGADAIVSQDNSLVLGNLAKVGIGTSTPDHVLHLKKFPSWGGYTLFSDSRTMAGHCNWDNAAFVVNGDFTKGIIVGQGNAECDENGPWTESFCVFGNGQCNATFFFSTSDNRFKKEVKTIENPLDIVKKLNGVSYKFSLDYEKNPNSEGRPSLGFIAQDVEKVVPEAVSKNNEGYYSLNYNIIVPILTNAIKEQQKQIEELRAIIEKGNYNTGIDGTEEKENGYLSQNAPNPFSRNTVISYRLPENTQTASIGIYDMNGKEVKLVPIDHKPEGAVTIDGSSMTAGMYIYSLIINGKPFETKRMVLTTH